MRDRLTARFYRRPTQVVARALLGKVIVHQGKRARITECEAYLGPQDKASHARFGRTKRSDVMFEAGGLAYVYLCYGVHEMFNVVTDLEGEGGAVLIRGVQLIDEDGDVMATDGPGKVTRALGIDRSRNRADLVTSPDLFISRGRGARRVTETQVEIGPRIGIDYAGEWASAPLRFVLR